MREWMNYKQSICNRGNLYRLKQAMKCAQNGQDLTVGFIGGSITQGSLSSAPEYAYAYLVYQWWQEQFPLSHITYVNAGIGGTTSHFGAARVDKDLLEQRPQVVFVEFSVNDESTEHFLETYEGLVRHIYQMPWKPAVILISNVYYNNGANAQLQHAKVGRHYELPHISMQSTIYPAVRDGYIANRDITPDDLHPNDVGHALVASVITYFLDMVFEERLIGEKPSFDEDALPEALTANTYEQAERQDRRNAVCENTGFAEDQSIPVDITDCFKNGWSATAPGSKIAFVVEGSGVAILYRRYVDQHAPKAVVTVDGEQMKILDGNFDETWGDKLELETVLEHAEYSKHRVEITILEDENILHPFYLVSIIVAK
jgi:lysophospholipase L1-like esterase